MIKVCVSMLLFKIQTMCDNLVIGLMCSEIYPIYLKKCIWLIGKSWR